MSAWLLFLLIDFILYIASPSWSWPDSRIITVLPGSGVYSFARALVSFR